MKKQIFAFALLLSAMMLPAAVIDKNWVIECADNAAPTEKKAAQEIAFYIKKICGVELPVVANAKNKKRAVTVRADRKLSTDEWCVKSMAGGSVMVSGGLPNGVLYGAYTFIEDILGCRFLVEDFDYIPVSKRKSITIPEKFLLQAKPSMHTRSIYSGSHWGQPRSRIFQVKRKYNTLFISPEYGWYTRYVERRKCHTFFLYTEDFPRDKEEYFSMDKEGNRQYPLNNAGPGNLCFTYPGARDLVFKKMLEVIERDRKLEKLEHPGMPHSTLIDVSANDNNDACFCKNCLALQEKLGGAYSGVVLDFINDIAGRLKKVYPEMIVQTFAYNFSQMPPTGIKATDNVLVQLAVLGGEFYRPGYFRRDVFRSLLHPNNAKTLDALVRWSASGADLRIWDYWKLWDQEILFPYTVVKKLPENMKIYLNNGVRSMIVENQVGGYSQFESACFSELATYLASKLIFDPALDADAVIEDYMQHYYEAAAPMMRKILDMISDGIDSEPGNIGLTGVSCSYLNKKFFTEADKIFDAAEKAVKGNPALLRRIGQERIAFDYSMLYFERKLGLDIDRAKVIRRLWKNEKDALSRFLATEKKAAAFKLIDQRYEAMLKGVEIPKEFAGKKVCDYPWFNMKKAWTSQWVDDPDAAGKRAMRFDGIYIIQKKLPEGYHQKPFEIGFTDVIADKVLLKKVYDKKAIPADEKYHWYHIGRSKMPLRSNIYLHQSKQMPLTVARGMFDSKNPDKEFDIYVSVKLEGPSYAPGSKKADAIYVDRVIFAE